VIEARDRKVKPAIRNIAKRVGAVACLIVARAVGK